jgi:hypothetical protein
MYVYFVIVRSYIIGLFIFNTSLISFLQQNTYQFLCTQLVTLICSPNNFTCFLITSSTITHFAFTCPIRELKHLQSLPFTLQPCHTFSYPVLLLLFNENITNVASTDGLVYPIT